MNGQGPSSPRPSTSSQPIPSVYALDGDPFVASIPRPNLFIPHYDDPDPFAYPGDAQARASSPSLVSTSRLDSKRELPPLPVHDDGAPSTLQYLCDQGIHVSPDRGRAAGYLSFSLRKAC
jgi:hypothetical protein